MNRNTFVFYKDWKEAISDLSDDIRLEIYESIIEYATTGNVQGLKPMAKIAFNFIKTDIDRDTEKYISIAERNRKNGGNGGRPPNKNPKNPLGFQETQRNPKNLDNDNVNDNEYDLYKEIDKEKPNRFLHPSKNEVIDFFMSLNNLKPSEAENKANSFYSHYSKLKWANVENWQELAERWKECKEVKAKKMFKSPTLDEVFEYYTNEKELTLTDAEYWANRFMDFYEAKGWKVGNQSMKDWKAAARNCIRTWDDKRRNTSYTHPAAKHQQNVEVDKRF